MSDDRLARIEGWFTGTYAHYLTGEESEAVLALVEIAERAGPMARLPIPLSADERQQWLIRQNELRDAFARLDGIV